MTLLPKERHGGWIQTYTGRKFYPMDPLPSEICIEDIAHSLSNMCRYAGHCDRFYSVAEHCVLLSQAAEPIDKLWALLHDASEAYLVDVPSPIKPYIPGYRTWEARIMRCVATTFSLSREMPYTVDLLDKRIIKDEKAQNVGNGPGKWINEELVPLGVTLQFWTPLEAEAQFLMAFDELRHSRRLAAA